MYRHRQTAPRYAGTARHDRYPERLPGHHRAGLKCDRSLCRHTALSGREGAVSFYCPLSHPTFDAGFTGSGGNTCEYGYRFDREGNVYVISGGQAGTTAVATGVSGSAVSIRREDGQVYLRIDGIGSQTRTIPLARSLRFRSGLIRAVTSEEPLRIARCTHRRHR